MNDHVDGWMDAYLDGELTFPREQQVSDHLIQCQRCQGLLAKRCSLSTLLQEFPPARGLKPQDQFLAEVRAQIQPGGSHTQRQNALNLGWQFVPLSLLLALIFFKTVSILNNLLLFAPDAGEILQQGVTTFPASLWLSLIPGWELLSLQLDRLSMLSPFSLGGWDWYTSLIILAGIGITYIGWLASWFARYRQTSELPAV